MSTSSTSLSRSGRKTMNRMRFALEALIGFGEGYTLTEQDIWDLKAIVAAQDGKEHHRHKGGAPCVNPACGKAQIPRKLLDMIMARELSFDVDRASPPGETIEDLLEEHEMDWDTLSEKTGWNPAFTQGLLSGHNAVTPSVAKTLVAVFGSTESFWLRREAQYRMTLAGIPVDGS